MHFTKFYNKKVLVVLMCIAFTVLVNSNIFAQDTPNLIGRWQLTAQYAHWDDITLSSPILSFKSTTSIIVIVDQQGNRFAGYNENNIEDPLYFTGVIDHKRNVTFQQRTNHNWHILTGRLKHAGETRSIVGTFHGYEDIPEGIESGTFEAVEISD